MSGTNCVLIGHREGTQTRPYIFKVFEEVNQRIFCKETVKKPPLGILESFAQKHLVRLLLLYLCTNHQLPNPKYHRAAMHERSVRQINDQ